MRFGNRLSRGGFFTPVVTIYILLSIAVAIISYIAKDISLFAVSASNLQHLRLWTLITFTLTSQGIINLLFNALAFVLIGSFIEKEWKSGPFAIFLAVVSFLTAISWIIITSLIGQPALMGVGGRCLIYAMLVVLAILKRNRSVNLLTGKIKVTYICLFFILIAALQNIAQPILLVMLSGALWGYLYILAIRKSDKKAAGVVSSSPRQNLSRFSDLD